MPRLLKFSILIMLPLILGAAFWHTTDEKNETVNLPLNTEHRAASSSVPAAASSSSPPEAERSPTAQTVPAEKAQDISLPLSRAEERVTKKPFGIFVTKETSPVSPERFYGYHTGTDFEAFKEEAGKDVPISAICSGKLLRKTTASGYGGYAAQSCRLEDQAVTVIYGHLRLSSISQAVGQEIQTGEFIGHLGEGYTNETDNERKHLHLGIHKGSDINIKGYVQSKAELEQWMDAQKVLMLQQVTSN